MSKRPLVSILIPVYNREEFVGSCIQSAMGQTIDDLEIIVVDNASTDNTWNICQQYANKDSRIRLFQNDTNLGPVRNWQRCIGEAKGNFGKILFSDDLIHSHFLEKTLPYIEDNSVAFVFSRVCIGEEEWKGHNDYQYSYRSSSFSTQRYYADWLFRRNVPVSPGCALFRIKDLRENLVTSISSPTIFDFEKHGAGPDLLLFLLTAINYKQIAYVDETLTFFRSHPGSITIGDKTKYLDKCYVQAKVWFLDKYFHELLDGFLFAEWLKERKRTEFEYRTFVSHYLFQQKTINLKSIMKFQYKKVSHKLKKNFGKN